MIVKPPTKIYVTESPIHGLGVFCSSEIKEGEVFEVCPIIDMRMSIGETSPVLLDYRFNWPQGETWEKQVVGLGYASLYNHSESPNAAWRSNIEDMTFEFFATKDINPNEEILVWYGGDNYWNDGRVKLN